MGNETIYWDSHINLQFTTTTETQIPKLYFHMESRKYKILKIDAAGNSDAGGYDKLNFFMGPKAFDTINHNIIIRKLSNYGVDQEALRWFQSYLSDRSQKCSVNGYLSTALPITCGVPQGSIILSLY